MTNWLHFSPTPITALHPVPTAFNERRTYKPDGFWATPDRGENWRWWCEQEHYEIPETQYVYRVTFHPTARLLTLATDADIRTLTHKWTAGPHYPKGAVTPGWLQMLASGYDGILIPEYHWACRLTVPWYYGWDCASGCIWNTDAIASLTLSHTLAAADRMEASA